MRSLYRNLRPSDDHKSNLCMYIRIYLLKVLMCDCATNAFQITTILVNRDSLDVKEIMYAIIRNFI